GGSSDFGMVHNARKGIWNLKDKTSCELSILAAGVYETGSVRQELTVQHDLGHGVSEFFALQWARLGLGNMIHHTVDDVGPFLKRLSIAVGNGVTFPRNFLCVMPKFRFGRGLDECAHF